MTDRENKALYIAEQCRKAGMTLAGAAGVIASVQAESAFKSTNLQDTYEKALGYNDESYTAAVDNGSYQNFTGDSAGYGLCQWTAGDRKDGMLKFHRQRGVSIGDFRTQVDWLMTEIRSYSRAWSVVTSSQDPFECGYAVCRYYEIPADTENQANYRGGIAQQWYSFLSQNIGAEYSIPVEDTAPAAAQAPASVVLDEDGMPIPKTWPPRTLHKDRCSGWKEIKLLQILLDLHGYNVLTDGMFGDALEEKVKKFQQAAFPNERSEWDGIAGPKTWAALGVKMS